MKRTLSIIILALGLHSALTLTSDAGGTGYESVSYGCDRCADSKFQTPRYQQLLPYRHYEDHRRYNAAPCCGEPVRVHPYLLKTVVVNKKRVPYYTYDENGNRYCRRVVMTTYKEIYSDGSCRVWTRHG